jgi:uroporphyrinogen decarboxylase
MRQAGRYLPEYQEIRKKGKSFLDLCFSPARAAEVTLQPIKRFGMDAAILFSDILVVPHALGQGVDFLEGRGPVLDDFPGAAGLGEFNPGTFHKRLEPVYETVSRVREKLDESTALIGFCGAPWTVATYMIEGGSSRNFRKTKTFALDHQEEFLALLNLLVEASVHYLGKQIERGAEVIQIFDSWAGALDEKQFRQWVIKPTKEITARLRETHPRVPVIGFPKHAGPLYVDYVKEACVSAVSLDQTVPASWAAQEIQPLCVAQGNLDPRLLVTGGEAMREAASDILSTLGRAPFIFNLGHGVLPETPPEHVAELAAIVRSWLPR